MRRREFITLLGGAVAAWPQTGRAQQPALPVIGYLSVRTLKSEAPLLARFRQGLSDGGFVADQNVAFEYRFADGRYDRLPDMAADLVRHKAAVIFSGGGTTPAAKAATREIPIVFSSASDPVESGLVESFNRPGGNLTGVSNVSGDVTPKRLQLLHEMVPSTNVVGYLLNASFHGGSAQSTLDQVRAAATTLGLDLHVLEATSEQDFPTAFAALSAVKAGALLIAADAYFTSRGDQLAQFALRHDMPASYQFREFAAAGGLMSYGGSIGESYRLAGTYVARILKGAKPAELPIQQSTKVELIINLKTARTLGLTVPPSLLAIADEVIE